MENRGLYRLNLFIQQISRRATVNNINISKKIDFFSQKIQSKSCFSSLFPFLSNLSKSCEINTKINRIPGIKYQSFSSQNDYLFEDIIISKNTPKAVATIRLNRPKALNALSERLTKELITAVETLDKDDEIRAIIITGNEKAFAAGADIKMMSGKNFSEVKNKLFIDFDRFSKVRKPIIAAVNGYALGGGCELAMMCDIILAGDKAIFGQPEVTIGTIPGLGGTQRLCKAVGKSIAMEMILTGRPVTADEAFRAGLVSRVVEASKLEETALDVASKIASFSSTIIADAKEAVNRAYNTTLEEGLLFERKTFYSTFATKDCKEGMTAFVEKRKPNWENK